MRPLTDWPDDALRDHLERIAGHLQPAYNDVLAEIDRRAARANARDERRLVLASVMFAAIAAIASMIASVASLVKP